jgi:TPR repeat protein
VAASRAVFSGEGAGDERADASGATAAALAGSAGARGDGPPEREAAAAGGPAAGSAASGPDAVGTASGAQREPATAPSDAGTAGLAAAPAVSAEIVPSGQPGRLGEVLTQIAHLDRRLEDALKPVPQGGTTPQQLEREADIFRHMAQAAQRGFPNAQYNFARMLIHGRGAPRDLEQAAQWLERSSERGYTPAQLLLGYIEAGGLGGKPDLGKAAFWWTVAERRGNKTAAKARELMNPLLNSGDIIAARRLRAQWRQLTSTLAPPVDHPQDLEALNEELRDAAEAGDSAALLSALLQGADADSRDPGGRNAVINAAWRGRKEILEIMLSNGADTEAADDDGRTALIWGAINGHQAIVRQLIDAGSNPNRADANGVTALMRAAWNGHPAVVEELLRYGANPAQRDKDGKTALDHARQEGHATIVRRLQAAK